MAKDFSYQFYSTTAEAWDAMYEAIGQATHSIYWEVFIFIDDVVGQRFVKALCEKARSGLKVKVIIDAVGSFYFSRQAEKELKDAGVELLRFSRLYPELRLGSWFNRLLHRNHRKVMIIDESVVFLGGVNVDVRYHHWDDVYLKITGKVARPLLRGFAKSYVSSGGDKKNVWHLLHPKLTTELPAWREKLKFIVHSPHDPEGSSTKQVYLQALALAKESVNLLTPYYVPNKAFLQAVTVAKQRGVKVNIFLPLRPDHKIMAAIARAYYGLTMNAGASLYFLPEMNHGKALSVDDKLGLVGSININNRSFYLDEESGVSFSDRKMVAELNGLFNTMKAKATPFDEKIWKGRGMWSRCKERLAKVFEKFL